MTTVVVLILYKEKCQMTDEYYCLLSSCFLRPQKLMKSVYLVNLMLCSKCQIDGEDFFNFCSLLRKRRLYRTYKEDRLNMDGGAKT